MRAVVALAASLVLLAGCADDARSPKPRPVPSTSHSTAESEQLPQIDDAIAAPEALTLGTCRTTAGQQRVDATVTGVVERADYLVTVTWVDAEGDPVGSGWAVVPDLAHKDRADVTIKAEVAPDAQRCVAGVVYGTLP